MRFQKDTIRFYCTTCKASLEANIAQAGNDIKCQYCSAALSIPRIPINPLSRPILAIVQQMRIIPIAFPFFPQIIQFTALSLVLIILATLFITVGLAAQVCGVFEGLILDAQKQMAQGSAVEKSAQAISIGIYVILMLPFWFIKLPFSLIGSLWSSYRKGSFLILLLLLTVLVAVIVTNFGYQQIIDFGNTALSFFLQIESPWESAK